jgi:hypothetical protein
MPGQQAAVVEQDEVEAPAPLVLERLRDEDVVSVESDVRTQVAELGKELEIDARETIIFIHRKFIIVGYKW